MELEVQREIKGTKGKLKELVDTYNNSGEPKPVGARHRGTSGNMLKVL